MGNHKNEPWGTFNLTGKVKINDFTFKIDRKSTNTDYTYSMLDLGFFCNDDKDYVRTSMIGGYRPNSENIIHAHGINDDGAWGEIEVNWEDRFDKNILSLVSPESFIVIGLEKFSNGILHYETFLSEYDAIHYIKEHLTNDMIVDVSGDVIINVWNDNLCTEYKIKKIAIHQPKIECAFKVKKNPRKFIY